MLQGEEGRLYEDLGTYDLMKPVVEELLAEYNSKKKPMNLVFFDDAIEHLTRIHRILRLQQVSYPTPRTDTLTARLPALHMQHRAAPLPLKPDASWVSLDTTWHCNHIL